MVKRGTCGNALHHFTSVTFHVPYQILPFESELERGDLQLFLKAWSAFAFSPSHLHFFGASAGEDMVVVQSECHALMYVPTYTFFSIFKTFY